MPQDLDLPRVLEELHARNRRVEAEKAWEGSATRRGFLAVLTYATACAFLWSVGNPAWYVHALFPPAGYLLSTLSLPWVKATWLRHRSGS